MKNHGNHKGNKQPKQGTIGALKKVAFAGTSPKGMRKEIHAAANLQYNPQARQVRAEQRASNLQGYRDKSYFKQYNKSFKPLLGQTQKAYSRAGKQIDSSTGALTDYAAKLQSQLNSEAQTSANARGVGNTPDSTALKAALARGVTGNTLSGVVKSQGASQRSYLLDQRRIGKREKIDALQQEANRGRSYNQDLENLAREKGSAAAQARQQLLDANRQFYLGLKSSQTTRRGQNITAADSKRSSHASIANSKRTAASSAASTAASIGNSKRSVRSAQASSRRTARNEAKNRRLSRYEHNHPTSSTSSSSDVRPALAWFDGAPGGYANKHFGNVHSAVDAALGHNSTWAPADIRKAYRLYRKRSGGHQGPTSQATGGHRP